MLLLACIKKKLKMFSYPMDIWMDALTEEMPEATLLFFYSPPLFFSYSLYTKIHIAH